MDDMGQCYPGFMTYIDVILLNIKCPSLIKISNSAIPVPLAQTFIQMDPIWMMLGGAIQDSWLIDVIFLQILCLCSNLGSNVMMVGGGASAIKDWWLIDIIFLEILVRLSSSQIKISKSAKNSEP